MAESNPDFPQVNDPEIAANLIRRLAIVGPLGRLNVLDVVIPTVSLAELQDQAGVIDQLHFIAGANGPLTLTFTSHVQLFNTVGSNRNILVESIVPYVDLDSLIYLAVHNVALTDASPEIGLNKATLVENSTATIREDATVAAGTIVTRLRILANTPTPLLLSSPIRLAPGQGILVRNAAIDTQIACTYEWTEVAAA